MFKPSLMHRKALYAVNAITLYRLASAPVLCFLIAYGGQKIFGIMLAISFFTDMADGFFARRFKATSIFGSKLDSVADDLTIFAAIAGIFVFKPDFIGDNLVLILILTGLYVLQMALALGMYHKISSFHTYLAKTSALLQGTFLILLFLLPQPVYMLFYIAAVLTILDLLEEIILVFMLPQWESDVKGILWVRRRKTHAGH